MGRISAGVGILSGIPSKDIIDQLMALEARPKQLYQQRIDETNARKLAYTDLSARLTGLKLSATTLKKPTTFQAANATSSNEDVISATAAAGAAKGSYQFQVARLVASQQSVSAGFADAENAPVGAGTITLELGGGEISSQTALAQLNGGAGVRRGSFRISDGSGKSAVIDISAALSLDDVVRKINTSIDVTVKAEVKGDRIVVTDLSGATTPNITVMDLGGGFAARDLGILGSSSGGVLTGTDINYLGRGTALSDLNDGRGVRTARGADDFQITNSAGVTFNISVHNISTVGGLIDAINTATGGTVTASVAAGSNGLALTDSGGGALSVTALNSSNAAADLGILGGGTGSIAGSDLIASPNSVLLQSLRGGQGLSLGTVQVTDRTGAMASVDLTGAKTVNDLLDGLNSSGVGIKAELKASGNGIQITDTSGGAGSLIIADGSSTTAAELGIAGTFNTTVTSVQGSNLQRKWVSENTLLASYNGGKGVAPGKFKVTNSAGVSAEVDLTQGNEVTLQDVISEINSRNIGVTASINANGDGLLLTDAAGGTLTLKVEDVDGTTARDLGILGEAAAGTPTLIDGSLERTIAVTATDTLSDVEEKVNALGFGLSASVINDGSGATPFRLSFSARNSGRAGRVVLDAGATSLGTRNLVESQDAAVFFGGAATDQPLVISSSSNQIKNVIKGVTLDLHGVSAGPVTVNVTENTDGVLAELKKFADGFNGMVDKIKELTAFNSETKKKGALLGERAVQQVEFELYAMVQTAVTGAGRYRTLLDVGVKVAAGGKLGVDEEKFAAAFSRDAAAVQQLFAMLVPGNTDTGVADKKGLAGLFEDKINKLIDPENGIITRTSQTLDRRTEQFQDRIEALDRLLESKKARLERQFANMEKILAGLTAQQQSLASFQPMQTPSPRTSAA